MRVRVGSFEALQRDGRLVGKAGGHGVCVFWHDGRAYALDDRCPHMGFPLHRGTVEAGLVTCHWHHARFDLASGGTLDPFADDARAFPVEVEGDDVYLTVTAPDNRVDQLRRRLAEGLEGGLTLVTAKAVHGLLEADVPAAEIVRVGVEFGTANRAQGWGSGLTVLVAMANLLSWLDPADHALALVHGLAFVARDTANRPPRFPLAPLGDGSAAPVSTDRLTDWYRRFIETRSADAAERTLVTALSAGTDAATVSRMMSAAVTDHVFIDVGHTLDFTNKAFEAVEHLGWGSAATVLPTLTGQTARASRSEEGSRWRHPHDLAALVASTEERLPALLAEGRAKYGQFDDVSGLGWQMLDDEPHAVVQATLDAISAGATPEQLGRAVALAAGLRITRFHTQNDFGDWDAVHHGFTYANALHQCLIRQPSDELVRGVIHGALRVYLDRFLNVPAARLPATDHADLADLQACWDAQGGVDRAGAIAYGWLKSGGDPRQVVAALGHALLSEDAGFHWFQIIEAAVRQYSAWPEGSEEGALILTGAARFLAAHTPTRRELPHVVRTAARLRRGDDLFEES
ncbi:MAG: Ferredoxin reductase [uncultured Acidimicrobiales bacterium]|uniref:Ferredoxin reductase n=1 Tax=uncultured Acidimicrobiales bacterium TaxID=310071 RepID=A0A6J4HH11_9ACTN|nr:MAG: Ferredoxin reductase [uncultured Acidimicrobiales bacterium]